MTDLKSLKELFKLMADHGLTEVDLEDPKGGKVKLRRGPAGDVQVVHAAPASPAPVAPAAPAPPAAAPQTPAESPAPPAAAGGQTIESPMVGTFYAAASPEADAFVKVGDTVSADTVVCIIEAMKVMNEIKAEAAGTVAEVLLENGQPVEFGQPLFRIA
ncbi:MAG: acetyl-CoA carboxylase biotin carboxyl carrier protein [Planctomycetota bacterium]